MRKLLRTICCYLLGHLYVKPEALHSLTRFRISAHIEACCLRCGKQIEPVKKAARIEAEIFFRESPLAKKLREQNIAATPDAAPFKFEGK